jgi:hypothetical protein
MRDSTFALFLSNTLPLEGRCVAPYCDIEGNVTVAIGKEVSTLGEFRLYPWLCGGSSLQASHVEIDSAWMVLKAVSPDVYKTHRGGDPFWQSLTPLRLSDSAVDTITHNMACADEKGLMGLFPDWELWPDEAQAGTLMLAWACGVDEIARGYPKFQAACRAYEWKTAADESALANPENSPHEYDNRNETTKALFLKAAGEADTIPGTSS